MKIFGAGMAGLIAGHIFRRHNPTIFEAQSSLPNNHNALLRFRTNVVSEATGIPFKKVAVRKNIYFGDELHDKCTIKMANEYSQKVTGAIAGRSIWNLDPVDRYIAPPDFINQLSQGLDIQYGCRFDVPIFLERAKRIAGDPMYGTNPTIEPIISTIPMYNMMKVAGWNSIPELKSKQIWSLTADIEGVPCDVYQTIYFPDRKEELYRASITGSHIIFEFIQEPCIVSFCSWISFLLGVFGINIEKENIGNIKLKNQKHGKISNSSPEEARSFVMAMTDRFGIYSLGRFATWRQLLLDDMVGDCKVIDRLITSKSTYESKLNH